MLHRFRFKPSSSPYLAAMTAALFVVGPLGVRLGRRRVLFAGLVIFGAGSLMGTFASDLPIHVAPRSVQRLAAPRWLP
jgi:MFS family permease